MPPTDTLTIEEFDDFMTRLQAFLGRLRPTILLSAHNRQIRDAVDSLHQLVAIQARTPAPGISISPPAADVSPTDALPSAGASGPKQTFDDASVLEFIRTARGRVTQSAIIEAFGVNSDQVHYRLKRLITRNLIRARGKRGRKSYRLVLEAASPVEKSSGTKAAKGKAASTSTTPRARAPKQSEGTTREQSVLDVIRAAGPNGIAGADIRAALKLSDNQFRWVMSQLRAAGHVRMTGKVHLSRYHLTGGHADTSKATAASPTRLPKAPKKRRAPRGGTTHRDQQTVLDFIDRNPGLMSEVLVQKLGGDPVLIKAALKRLRKAGSVKVAGTRRGARYTAVAPATVSAST